EENLGAPADHGAVRERATAVMKFRFALLTVRFSAVRAVPARLLAASALLVASFSATAPVSAESRSGGLPLIRDAELEHIIRAYSTPIFQAAGLSTAKIQVHLVNDSRLNAFVAGGRHMFINTGLLMRAEHAGQVIGVIAHETGHIVGGHLVRLQRELEDAQIKQIISMILSMGAAVAARDSRVAIAGSALGQTLTEGAFFRFTRAMESAADTHALTTLDRL